jgi:Ser-tRNA(Ala) deacylase AlaX
MTEQIYLKDAYLTECEATILQVLPLNKRWNAIILDRTCLQPSHRDGGDKGFLVTKEGNIIPIENVVVNRTTGEIEHRSKFHVKISIGTKVKCVVDWKRRYQLMRKHTGNHLLYGCGKLLLGRGFPALSRTTLGDTYTHWFGQAAFVNEDLIKKIFQMANNIIEEGRSVFIETLPRQEALKKCGAYLETIVPRFLKELRVVTIERVDSCPCIGLHVRNVREIHKIKLVKVLKEGSDIKLYSDIE